MHIKLTLVGGIFLYWDNIFNFTIAFVDFIKFHISLLDYLFVCIYSVSRWHKWTLIYYNWTEKKENQNETRHVTYCSYESFYIQESGCKVQFQFSNANFQLKKVILGKRNMNYGHTL